MNNTIETYNLTKKFKTNCVVNNLNLKVPAGSIFAFLGPNGAGKTTTIKMLMNILPATNGTAKILGVDSQLLSPKEFMQIGYVSENQEMPEWMTVENFLKYCKQMYSTWDDAFCQKLLKLFDLPGKTEIKSLSRGMKMKAAMISSLAYRPKLLVLDEPFSGLDPLVREEFISAILELTESENWTIFISSHDINEVERLADWVGIIDKGELKVAEQSEILQKRVRRIDVTLPTENEIHPQWPAEWIMPEQKGRIIQFVDTQFEEGKILPKVQSLLGDCSNLSVTGLSLREIFLVFAKKFKIQNL